MNIVLDKKVIDDLLSKKLNEHTIRKQLSDYVLVQHQLQSKKSGQVGAEVSVKTADDLILYLEAKLIVDNDLLYGNKRNKEYFITGCYDNQEMIAQTSIKVYAKDFEEGTVVRIYLPNR